MEEKKEIRGLRKERVGVVVSDVQDKTLVVVVDRKTRHKKYKKIITVSKKYYVHDETNNAKKGDTVTIMEVRPISKLKRWRLIEVTQRAE